MRPRVFVAPREPFATSPPYRGPLAPHRACWGIENKLHWVVGVGSGEDLDRKGAANTTQNFSVLNRVALKLIKQDKTSKRGMHGHRPKADWDNV